MPSSLAHTNSITQLQAGLFVQQGIDGIVDTKYTHDSAADA